MIRLLLEPVNLLILDDPTNHLDMRTKDILKQAIKEFNGTVIVVSHDREFLDGLVEKVYEFGGGKVKECLGGIYEFLEKKKIASLAELEISQKTPPTAKEQSNNTSNTPPLGQAPTLSPTRLSYAEQREREKAIKRIEKKVKEAEEKIAEIENEIAEIEMRIANGDTDNDIFNLHADKNKQLENTLSVWELASMELDEIKSKYNNN